MKLIAAVSSDYGIGFKNDLLFKIPEDQKFFKEQTLGKTVVMGRKTFESLPGKKPLKDRKNIVLTRDKDFSAEGAEVFFDIPPLLEYLKGHNSDDVFVIGGETVYRALMPYCNAALVTKIDSSKEADRFFPDIDKADGWKLAGISEDYDYDGLKYRFCAYLNFNLR
jgi:dihydrofolate reductase